MQQDACIGEYLRDISRYGLLTKDEERELAYKVREGDEHARERMTNSNLGLVIGVVKHYIKSSNGRKVPKAYASGRVSFSDLIGEGNKGLLKAVQKFDPDKGYKFSTYATWWIKYCVSRALHAAGRVSSRLEFSLYSKKDNGEEQDLLDSIASDIEDPEDEFVRNEELSKLEKCLNKLDYLSRWVIEMRYGLNGYTPISLEEVGKEMCLSRERVRQIEDKALRRLRRIYEAKPLCPQR